MRLVNPFYRKLKPTEDYLSDKVVIAQAWKKTHKYIRYHNWYADNLQLDVSALSLESNVVKWSAMIVDLGEKPYEIELVPAAKSEAWFVDSITGWQPKIQGSASEAERNLNPPLRPLAHLKIRDQTWATAAMLCLADIVETAQGDCGEQDFFKAQRKNVYSYGNRLLCDWRSDKAWFRWGNGEIYRKFYSDYKSFLKRPIEIGRSIANEHAISEKVYVVNLDISKFYDHIDRSILTRRLKSIVASDGENDENSCKIFWEHFSKIVSWKWSEDSSNAAKDLNMELKDDGLPQGLVAAGFFANAYLVDFDKKAGGSIGEYITSKEGVLLHDYCRYVDDLRLVVSLEQGAEFEGLAPAVSSWAQQLLTEYGGKSLSLNIPKTSVTSLADLDNSGSLSERVASLQAELSGPADRDTLENAAGVLEGLLSVTADSISEINSDNEDYELCKIAKFDHDIRPDTLRRFAANRLERVMRAKRKINFDSDVGDYRAKSLDNESELLAKKLILAWMQDPSLALLLRKSVEIFPHPRLVEPVFSAIFRRVENIDNCNKVSKAMMLYLLADLFRCLSEFHGFHQVIDFSESSDAKGVLDVACRYAHKVMNLSDRPLFLERQALLFLAINEKPLIDNFKNGNDLHRYLHEILSGKNIKFNHQSLALYEIASQISGSYSTVAILLIESISNESDDQKVIVLDELAKRGGEFWYAIWRQLKSSRISKDLIQKYAWAAPTDVTHPKLNAQILASLIRSDSNPFVHEAALLKLAIKLVSKALQDEWRLPASIHDIEIEQIRPYKKWDELWRPNTNINVKLKIQKSVLDPRFEIPPWVDGMNRDAVMLYWVGTILRSSVTGSLDFTASQWKRGKVQSYKGLRTGWYKRRMGMMHSPESLVGEYSTVSDWLADLLMKCLQWPGVEATYLVHSDVQSIDTAETFISVLNKRLKYLDNFYCEASGLPTMVTSVRRPDTKNRKKFRLVTVQMLLPRASDFSKADPLLNNTKDKPRNRNHLTSICQLTYKTLAAKLIADGESGGSSADLIVFPELSVHSDDIDVLKRLADKTQAIIFAGLIFVEREGKIVNLARWIIPDYRMSGRQWILRDQGKQNITIDESKLGIVGHRPCQHLIEVRNRKDECFYLSGAICYDATDLKLAVDLKGKSDLFVISAHNKDITTFDAMASALHYHMYQHVVVVNKGEYGGSTIQAPYKQSFDRLISHVHGSEQISINVADLDLGAFKRKSVKYKEVKTPPAGL